MTEFDLRSLERFDTPTVCNALEMIDPERRRFGYTFENVLGINTDSGPAVGIAYTATMRSLDMPPIAGDQLKAERLRYYEYMSTKSDLPKICVMQDLDGASAGRGPFFGEFNTRVHRALGFSAIITDGSVRDVRKLPDDILILCRGLRPSHSFVHIVDFDAHVNVFGMTVSSGQVVHADEHGAVTFPSQIAERVSQCAEQFMQSEAPIIQACKSGDLTYERLAELYMSRGAIGDERSRPLQPGKGV